MAYPFKATIPYTLRFISSLQTLPLVVTCGRWIPRFADNCRVYQLRATYRTALAAKRYMSPRYTAFSISTIMSLPQKDAPSTRKAGIGRST